MPSSYTADLYDGKQVTFQEFIMKCARLIGYLKDNPDEFCSSDYHLVELEKAKQYLTKIEKWSTSQAEKEAQKAFDDTVCSNWKYKEEKMKIARGYIGMLKQVEKWHPPTKDHENLKCFMIRHIAENLESDSLDTTRMPRQLSGEQYRKTLLKSVRQEIAYHTKEHAEEVQNIAKNNKWVRDLRQSLNDFE